MLDVFNFKFGHTSKMFATYWGSFRALVRIIFGGFEIGKLDLGVVGWVLILLYCSVVSILMINLSLGIVLDAYNAYQKEREDSDTLPHSIKVYVYRKFSKVSRFICCGRRGFLGTKGLRYKVFLGGGVRLLLTVGRTRLRTSSGSVK